jgi:MFS family permease
MNEPNTVAAVAHRGGTGRGGPVLIGALVVDALGNGLFLPLSLVYFTRLTDIPLALLGVLISVGNVLTLPIPVFAGALVDRFGAVPLVVGAQLLQAGGFLAYAYVRTPVPVFLAMTAAAIGVRFFWSAIFTAITDYADGRPGGRLTKDDWFAWANMTRTAGLGVGGLVTGLVVGADRTGAYHLVAYATAGCFFVAAAAIALCVRAPRLRAHSETGGGYRALLRDRPFLGLTGLNTICAMTSMMLGLALPTFVASGLHGPGWLTAALLSGNTVLVSLATAPLVRRVAGARRTRVLVGALLVWAAWALLLAALRPGSLLVLVPLLAVGTLLFTVAESLHAPTSMALAAAVAPAATRGRYLASFQYSFTLAGIVAPTFFATLFGVHRALPWLALAVLDVATAAAFTRLERALPRTAPRS